MNEKQNDFSKGSVARNILNMAFPMTIAQLVNLLYNVVDRMYIGRMGESATLALTGVGLTLPVITILIAFANLFGMGGAPLCSIARGKGDNERAEKIIGNAFFLLMITGAGLTLIVLFFKRPILYLFGASDMTYPFADDYITLYALGNIFVMIGLGMNSFVNAQGFGRIGMMTVVLGAAVNIILDPILIFGFEMGVKGAALATIISQFCSALWILVFLFGKKSILKLRLKNMRLEKKVVKDITSLGLSGFTMGLTNSGVQIICNATLQSYGGDLYVGIMTVVNSVREVCTMPANGVINGAQPVISYNYGAKKYSRVRQGIKFLTMLTVAYMTLIWIALFLFPEAFIRIFNSDPQLIEAGIPAMHVYFFGFFMMAFQLSGQFTFVALGMSKQAVFFSLLRKAFIVIPLTIILPKVFGLGVTGVFLAEPISNFVGGTASFSTMIILVWNRLKYKKDDT